MTTKPKAGLTRAEAAELKALKAQQAVANARPAPTDNQAASIKRASERWKGMKGEDRTPPKIAVTVTGPDSVALGAPFNDDPGWSALWAESLGTNSAVMVEAFMRNAGELRGVNVADGSGDAYAKATREAGAFVAAMQPQSEVETALALQMCAAHEMTMKLSGHAFRTTDRNALSDYSRMLNQTMRTFATQVEALSKLRTGGKQQVEVRYVYVDARTQNLVQGRGDPGGDPQFVAQPHAPGAVGLPFAPGVPVWSEDPSGDAVPVASNQGAPAMPDAWGSQSRRAEGRGERQLRLRTVDGGDRASQGDGAGNGETLSEHAA